jgi:hypothetical protein
MALPSAPLRERLFNGSFFIWTILTELAKQDLRSIGRCTQVAWGKEQRNLYIAKIDAVLRSSTHVDALVALVAFKVIRLINAYSPRSRFVTL